MCLVLDPACFYRSLTLNLSLNILQAVEDVTTHPLKVDMANPKYVICWLRWCHGGNLIDPIGSRYIRAISVSWISTHMMRTRRNQILLNPLYVTGLNKSTRVQNIQNIQNKQNIQTFVILGRSKFTGIVLQGPKLKRKEKTVLESKGKPHTMTHGRDNLIVFVGKLNRPSVQLVKEQTPNTLSITLC